MYSILLIYLVIPLIFSHFFARLGGDFIIKTGVGNFESVKVYCFLLLMLLVILECGYRYLRENDKHSILKKDIHLGVLFGAYLIAISCIYVLNTPLNDILFGIGEKQHGVFMVLGLIILGIILVLTKRKDILVLWKISIGVACLISMVAIVEYFGYNLFSGRSFQTLGSWGEIRSTATLGNPNYLAGYLLMIVPIILAKVHRFEKYILISIVLGGIFATKSVIAGVIVFLFGLYLLCKKVFPKYGTNIWIGSTLIMLVFIIYAYFGTDKWLSFVSRGILMKEVLLGYFQGGILPLFIGNGPDTISRLFEISRSEEVMRFFPESMLIDSSHNIFIDILYSYGILGLLGFIYCIYSRSLKITTEARMGLLMGLVFLSLNIGVIAHLIILVLLLSDTKNIPKKT